MEFKVVVAVDAMGGDNAPGDIVQGAVDAVNNRPDIKVILTGDETAVKAELAKYKYNEQQMELIHCSEVIEMAEHPRHAITHKKDSSMVVGLNLVKNGVADAFVTAGNSGALAVGGIGVVRRIDGVKRTPFTPIVPTAKGVTLLADSGANVDVRPDHIVQFAQMGSIYMEHVMGVKNPTVGIINCGAEAEKGNALVKECYPLLEACESINFIGSVEAREIPFGACDVVVCDGFVGNVALKMYEGMGSMMLKQIKGGLKSNLLGMIGGLLIKPTLKKTLAKFDVSEHGGAPLLGLNGTVLKTHGSAKHKEVTNTIYQAAAFKEQDIIGLIKKNIQLGE